MFDLFRSQRKAVRYLLGGLLMLVAVTMVVTLIPGYGSSGRAEDTVLAEVGKEAITTREVQKLLQDSMRRKDFPAEMAAVFVPQMVDQFITERALAYEAKRMGMTVSDEELATTIRGMMSRFTGGAPLEKGVYEQIVNQEGLTVPEFENNLRKQMLLTRLQNLALEGIIVTPKEVEQEYNRRGTKVKIQYIQFKPENLKSQVKVTPEEMQAYYNGQKQMFRVPEKRNLAVLVADQDKIAASLQIPDAELRAAYDRNKDRFRTPERVKVRHILFQTTGKSPAETEKIKATAEQVLKQIKGGGDFAKLAQQYSDDPGSKSKGGDLDWVVRGQTVKNFENTAFSLKPNEISNLVSTEYGFHIIQVLDKQSAKLQPFEDVKDSLAADMKKGMIFDKMQNSADQARAALQKNPGNYAQIANEFGLELVKAENIAPGAPIPGVGQSPDLDTALISMKKGDVSPVVQVAPTKLAVVEVLDTVPARLSTFEEVQENIRTNLTAQKAAALASQKAADAVKRLKSGESMEAVAKALGGEVKTSPEFTAEGAVEGLGSAALFTDAFTKPVGSILDPVQAPDGTVVAKIESQVLPDKSQLAAQREAIVFQLKQKKAQERQQLFADSILTELIREGKVKKHEDTIKRLIASYSR